MRPAVASSREYLCLACPRELRVPLAGKLKAHLHVTHEHGHLLDLMHVDELLEQLPQVEQLELDIEDDEPEELPPFLCLRCPITYAYRSYPDFVAMQNHLVSQHQCRTSYNGHDYKDSGPEVRAKAAAEIATARFAAACESLVGVADFLVECESAE